MKATSSDGSGASRTTSRRKARARPGGCPSSKLCRTREATARRFVTEATKAALVDRNRALLEEVAKSLPAD